MAHVCDFYCSFSKLWCFSCHLSVQVTVLTVSDTNSKRNPILTVFFVNEGPYSLIASNLFLSVLSCLL